MNAVRYFSYIMTIFYQSFVVSCLVLSIVSFRILVITGIDTILVIQQYITVM